MESTALKPAFERISYYKFPMDDESTPFQYRTTYYFDNGQPHRWLELDSVGKVLTDYIYSYDSNWTQTGAKYREPGEEGYALEKVRFVNDSTRITEWIDSLGQVFYTMTDNLNKLGKTYRATFQGDEVHGYDSTFYTPEGFEKRIFFTNVKGKVYNDRSFRYDSINAQGEWVSREKIMGDTLNELHAREIYYGSHYTTQDSLFYPGVISTGEWSENTFSLTADEKTFFLTRTAEWDVQSGHLSTKNHGIFTETTPLTGLDSIYNGAISPDGNSILFSNKSGQEESIWLLKNKNGKWSQKINLTQKTGVKGGYFHWFSNSDIYFYIPDNNGDIVRGFLDKENLIIKDRLPGLNTEKGTEFSPYMDKEKRLILFTRYLEGDTGQQGFFVSYNLGNFEMPLWSEPEKLEMLPYGWNGLLINEGNQFLYTDGEDIKSLPVEDLGLKLPK